MNEKQIAKVLIQKLLDMGFIVFEIGLWSMLWN